MTLKKINFPENLSEIVREDVLELQEKIHKYKEGLIPEDRFKSFRLTRGVYGQRQLGVQMFRIKLPYGKMTTKKLARIAELSKEYTNGNLHTTTRQNIQLHFVHLEDTPEMWAKLEETDATIREACGNTVRNITASPLAGIDPDEPFDVTPYADATFRYLLRYGVNHALGRKFKIAFSSSEKDSAFTYFHDVGLIPRVKTENGEEIRGFKVMVAGGLGAQAKIADLAFEFLPEDDLIPFIEGVLRIFDRYGEREKRMKARMKYMVNQKKGLSLEEFLSLVEGEYEGLGKKTFKVDRTLAQPEIPDPIVPKAVTIADQEKYELWLKTNVFEQKQKGFYGVNIKLELGNISSERALELAALVDEGVAADDIRITINQGLLLKFVRKENLPYLFYQLDQLDLAEPGFGTIADVTACPGTDTCNLAVTNSTGIAQELENLIKNEYPELITNSNIAIKISGCMNACGQHTAANIGLHGSSIKNGDLVIPAMQVLLGGGVDPSGKGFIAEKVVKLPSKKIPQAFRLILNHYAENALDGEYFNDYYYRNGKMFFYNLLKPLADTESLIKSDFVDWGHTESFIPEIGTGECAGVVLDAVGLIIEEAEERLFFSDKAFDREKYADAIYHGYSAFVIAAKALLLTKDVRCNTHRGIITDFDKHFYETGEIKLEQSFEDLVLQMSKNEPTKAFAQTYTAQAVAFVEQVKQIRNQETDNKVSVEN